jgi:hypothetical protein
MLRCIQLQFSKRPTILEVSRFVSVITQISGVKFTLRSIFRLRIGDSSNCAHWGRCVLLVCCWIWRRGTPRTFPFCPHRHFHHHCRRVAHRPRILLFSDLENEQTDIMDLLGCRCCMYSRPSRINQAPDVFLSVECGSSIYRGGVGGYRG